MSVLACDRTGCDNVMCDRICHGRQEYLCDECFDELVQFGPGTDLDTFMGSYPVRATKKPAGLTLTLFL